MLRVSGSSRRGLAAGCLVLASAATVGCQGSSEERASDSCAEIEGRDYPALERLADDLLTGVQHTLLRVSSCEDTGQPAASVSAQIPGWTERRAAVRYLKSKGWTPKAESHSLVSSDGEYFANIILAREPEESPFIDLRFSLGGSR